MSQNGIERRTACDQSGVTISSQDRSLQSTVEHRLDDPVDAARSVSHDRVQQQTAEHIVDELFPQTREEVVEVVKFHPREQLLESMRAWRKQLEVQFGEMMC